MMNDRPLISIKEARKLLGKEAKTLSDVEVLEIINDLRFIAKEHLKKKSVNKSNNSIGL